MRRHIVIGGGIAGVCCVEELCRLRPDDAVTLISSSTVLKGIDNIIRITKTIEEVSVRERDLTSLQHPNLTVRQAVVTAIDTHNRVVHVEPGGPLPSYDRLCIACGARPKVLGLQHERIVTLRDTQSVEDFAQRLSSARRIAVVGNGGIALELVGALRDVEVVWVMKHEHIGDAFFDVDAAEFLLGELQQQQQQQQQHVQQQPVQQQEQQQQQQQPEQQQPPVLQQPTPAEAGAGAPASTAAAAAGGGGGGPVKGHAAGPKWVDSLPKGRLPANVRLERHALVVGASSSPRQQDNHRSSHTQPQAASQDGNSLQPQQPQQHANGSNKQSSSSWPLYLQLSTGEEVGVDLLVQAIGVEPSTDWLPAEVQRAADGGILVGGNLESVSTPGVFAAGDCCTVDPGQQSPHWFQMRLWTQARLMGTHAAACMAGADESEVLNFSFELFTHVTRFLGRKVVLLGLYNGQKLQQQAHEDVVMYSRVLDAGTPAATFVRVLLLRGRLQGAVLIGETELEETFENLILDGLDLSQYGPALLDPDIELDHVFD